MNEEFLLEAMGEAPDCYILEAVKTKKMVHNGRKYLSWKRGLLAAVVMSLALLLVGCGVAYVLNMQSLQIGVAEVQIPVEDDGSQMETVSQQILTFSGIKGSDNYQAVQEWLEFSQNFDKDGSIWRANRLQEVQFPREFEAYSIYSQEQAQKLQEIADKYGLTLAGPKVEARTPRSLFAYLNLDGILVPGAQAQMNDLVTQYYEEGLFYADFYLKMEAGQDHWPQETLCLYYYTPKHCFNSHLGYLLDRGDWQEWNYTTASGNAVLMLQSSSQGEAYIYCDQPQAASVLKVYTTNGETEMTRQQLEQIADTIQFSLEPQPGDPALLAGFGAGIDPQNHSQTQNGYTVQVKSVKTDGEIAYITLGITAPEGVVLAQKDAYISLDPGNRGEGLALPKDKEVKLPYLNVNWYPQEDGDGLDHTQDLLICVDSNTMDASGFSPESQWSLYLEDLKISQPDQPRETMAVAQGVWQFDLSFDQGDFREVEFIAEPVTVENAPIGDGKTADLVLTSLKLRTYSGCAVFREIAGSLSGPDESGELQAVLKDGSTIPLYHVGGPGLLTRLQPEKEIPLEAVEFVLLTDGRKLYPVSN